MNNCSSVARTMGAGVTPWKKGAEQWLRVCLPKAWKSSVVSSEGFEQSSPGLPSMLQHVIRLERFPYSKTLMTCEVGADDAVVAAYRAAFTAVRAAVCGWIEKLPGVKPAGASGRIGFGYGWWSSDYVEGPFAGTLNAWVVPQGRLGALLIVSLSESRLRRPALRRARSRIKPTRTA